MSWSFGFITKATVGAFDTALSDAKDRYIQEQDGFSQPVPDETLEAIDAAGVAARSIVGSLTVADKYKNVNVVLAGHTNPGHQPVPGMANDQITVSVYQVT